ncbi:enoyl-CoA hydratase-related protein [Pseudosulfitobacter pseudonitzschiae]|uniref:enoyl-CoA hydratase-related protein n=1 Tax=Pseudosulfitobacter pseudonitzschiae TaxID=1402135 RepID=UPI001AF8FF6C|nr:enoyl-CoA hydratase-related protein [Pseudosulfitobacter pseudonitzschiae]MBM1814793.1 enoyl-CoA hydratase/isomerase family protein [Pseudosulfitobacter pseudonitzschiae]MBM1831787.1 enoyl-CoA hydratase/isomerase family protein [Pseudosulfitobacter pseudonitzschiae]MBM1836652.1 enoyl-CoA hydratase/isomerase family protein [Pseudosulfitobacter pseudonitzschiae]MBM1841499.1 enoyl-CoA hydratase/isomerase family protein [Pseudosulfitobacter pseudonitzschiae]MBM1846366.1 enoyl-CoA hydratase/isom
MPEFVTTEVRGPILIVTMNRPEVYNAVHPPMHMEMDAIWNDFRDNNDLWVAVLTGAGDKAFSAGNDLKYSASGKGGKIPDSGFAGLAKRFDLDKPVIAAVNGFAMGGGFEAALACDIIIGADNSTYALPEVKVGFFAATGGVQRLSRFMSRTKANELLFTGRHMDATEALGHGILNAVVPQAELMDAAMKMAQDIASQSPSSVRATKRVLNDLARAEGLDDSLAYSYEVLGGLMKTEDHREGVTAFVEKRKPKWVNR